MDIEQRLRSELERTGQAAAVSPAPPIEDLAVVAGKRHQRNRLLSAAVVVAVGAAIGLGALFTAGAGDSSLEVADGGVDAVAANSAEDIEPASDQGDPTLEPAVESEGSEQESGASQSTASDGANVDVETDAGAPSGSVSADGEIAEDIAAFDGVSRSLQVDQASVEVETRSSAVSLAAGSGVLVVADGAGGYGGLATRFGSETSTIGLSSVNGLDWSEVELSGVPAGATASLLVEHDGTFVALFESFEPSTGRSAFVGTSTDLSAWDVSGPLAGEPFATGLAVGDAGVIILGDSSAPDVWVGPIGGPYERTARLAALAVNGVTTLGDEFLVAGRSDSGATLFRSTDGIEWTGSALTWPNIPGSTPVVSVDGGTIVLSNVATGGRVSLISTDGGETWDQLNADSDRVVVNSSTLGFLSVSSSGAAVAIADDESFVAGQIDVVAPDRLSIVAAGNDEVVLLQATETGVNWIVVSR